MNDQQLTGRQNSTLEFNDSMALHETPQLGFPTTVISGDKSTLMSLVGTNQLTNSKSIENINNQNLPQRGVTIAGPSEDLKRSLM